MCNKSLVRAFFILHCTQISPEKKRRQRKPIQYYCELTFNCAIDIAANNNNNSTDSITTQSPAEQHQSTPCYLIETY
ncbi:unnamed protein product [Ceratitis capitata]|uniref:(Mediterranean fruit fly) hypothetical protein n=1 Tax=Ceratitis capitata TaxID=7213 RepID=A0A811UNU7_CERCA|nr:unnamed protein product [Ceratitis capitata]